MEEKQSIIIKNGKDEYKEYKNSSNNNDTQLLQKYIHDIRNSKIFDRNTLKNINNLSYEDRFKILLSYNDMVTYYVSFFEEK